ncbi:MAG: hypothetical protein HQK89_07935 [Nitrospirae bacterium]|nr:hypothetical protein [Nitrospirota bacterium]
MKNIVDVIKELLVPDILGKIILDNTIGQYYAQLKEDSTDSKLREICILEVPEDSILIKLDKYKQPQTLVKNKLGQRQRCDYVLLTSYMEQRLMLFIEPKSVWPKYEDIVKQFKGSECVMDYCNAFLNRFHAQDNLFEHFQKRFVVFYYNSGKKQNTRPQGPSLKNDIPREAYKYPLSQGDASVPLKNLVKL